MYGISTEPRGGVGSASADERGTSDVCRTWIRMDLAVDFIEET
jgi:hypothetical protein